MGAETQIRRLARMHRRARERGVSRPLYVVARALLGPWLHLWFRLRITGAEHIPATGPAIIACNHKSFLDPFFIGYATHRHVRYMAKRELMRGLFGRVLLGLGAFPVRRGESDAAALETAQAILATGGLLVMFPEGTRVAEPDALGAPHHGAGRLAIQTGAPIVPAAIAGTDHLWLGPFPRPRRVRLTFLAPLDPGAIEDTPAAVNDFVDHELWPVVQDQYGRQADLRPRQLGTVEPLRVRRARSRHRLPRRHHQ